MIAISYRRQDSSPVAGRLYDRLQAEFGKGSVFMDFDSIPYGVDFREHIKQTLQRAKVVVAIIGPEWSGGKELSNRRIDDPTDFVRLEVASALENGIPIIPVLINNTPMPEARNLPPELEGLAFRNGLTLDTGIDFHHHADRLIAGIHRVVDPPKEAVPPPPPVPQVITPVKVETSSRKFSLVWPITIAVVALAGIAAWYFFPGRGPSQVSNRQETPVTPRSEATALPTQTAAPTVPKTQPVVEQPIAPSSPAATSAATDAASPPASVETGREQTFTGKVGAKEATFRLRFESGGHVTGTYAQGGATYRLEGRHPKGKLLLDEYTGERISAHIELNLVETGTSDRWEGTMRNTPPDNRVFPVFFERATVASTPPVESPASTAAENSGTGDYNYRGTVGPYEAAFQLRFEPNGRVTGTYSLATNKNLVLRLEGRNPKGKLFLDEYTRDRLTARIELTLNDSGGEIRWEGKMYNTPPDNRVFPVSFARPRK
jgi:TIR domain